MRNLKLILLAVLLTAVGCSEQTPKPLPGGEADSSLQEFAGTILGMSAAGEDLVLLLDGHPSRTLIRLGPDGARLWDQPVEGLSLLTVSADGSRILMRDEDFSKVLIYGGADGRLVSQFPYEYPHISEDGSLIIVTPDLSRMVQAYDGRGRLLWSRNLESDANAVLAPQSRDVLYWTLSGAGLLDRDGNTRWTVESPEGEWIHSGQVTPDGRVALIVSANAPPAPHLEAYLTANPGTVVRYRAMLVNREGERLADGLEPGRLLPGGGISRWKTDGIWIQGETGKGPIRVSVPDGCTAKNAVYRIHRGWVLILCEVGEQFWAEIRDFSDRRLWQGAWDQHPLISLTPESGSVWVAEGQTLRQIQVTAGR